MKDGGLLAALPAFENKKDLITKYQDTDDIVNELMKHHKLYANDYDNISQKFWKGNAKQTAKSIFDFLKKNVRYDVEPQGDQTVKSPAAILSQKHGDCKHYSSFICGVVDSLHRRGYPIKAKYRFASYSPAKINPHHVFAVVLDRNGNEYWTDPVFKNFDNRNPYAYSYDKSANMALSSIHGIGRRNKKKKGDDEGSERRRLRKARKKLPKGKARRKQAKKDRGGIRKQRKESKKICKANVVKKVSLAAARNSFLLILKMNLFRKSSKLYSKLKDNPDFLKALQQKWCKLGGNWYSLKNAINAGVRVWNRHHTDKKLEGKLSGIYNDFGWDNEYKGLLVDGVGEVSFGCDMCRSVGVVPVVAAGGAVAIISAAIPIIKALAGLFKKAGVPVDDMMKKGKEGDDMIEEATDNISPDDEVDDKSNADFMDDELVESDVDNVPGDYEDPIEEYQEMSGLGSKKKRIARKAANAAKKSVKKTTLKIPLSKNKTGKVKTKNIKRAPFIQIVRTQTPAVVKNGNVVKQPTDIINIPKVSYNLENPTNDKGGVSDFFEGIKTWYVNNKEWINPVGGTAAGLYLASRFTGKKRR